MEKYVDLIVKASTSKSLRDLEKYYGAPNIFNDLKIARREVELHSSFLRWLFSPDSNHNLGSKPLELLLQAIAIAKLQDENKDSLLADDMRNAFLVNGFMIDDATAYTEVVTKEHPAKKNQSKRVDLLLELVISIGGRRKILPIIIENKDKSGQHGEQPVVYKDWAMKKYKGPSYWSPIYIFLKPSFHNEKPKCKDYITLTYQNLVDYVIESCLSYGISDYGHFFIKQYLRCISVPDMGKLNEEKTIMAMSKEEKELLKEYYLEHSSLIQAVICAYIDDPETEEDEKESLKSSIAILNTASTRSEKFEFNGIIGKKGATAYNVVKAYVDAHPSISEEDLRKVFPDDIRKSSHEIKSGGVIKNYADPNMDKKRSSDPITIGGGVEIAVSNQFIPETFDNFIKAANKENYIIKRVD